MQTDRVAFSLKLPASSREAIRRIATAQHRSLNAEVNVAIERHIREVQK